MDNDKFLLELDFFDKKRDGFLGSSGHSERAEMQKMAEAVSYTHLTLPTSNGV